MKIGKLIYQTKILSDNRIIVFHYWQEELNDTPQMIDLNSLKCYRGNAIAQFFDLEMANAYCEYKNN